MTRTPLSYNEIDADGLSAVLKSYQGRDHQEIVHDFEQRLGTEVGCSNVTAVQSGTAAMHLALRVVGVQPGDFVIAPTFAYVASVSPILYLGAHPVLIDSEELTWNMDPVLLEQGITQICSLGKKVGAIVVVHNYGMPARMDLILPIAKKWGIPLIEDAAESFGSRFRGKWTGTLGDVGVLSFNSNKGVTAFGGGALVSGNPDIIDKARYLASHARSAVQYYQHEEVGHNYRMSPLIAAYGLLQLTRMAELLRLRKEIYEHYRSLGEKFGLRFQAAGPEVDFQPWLPACILPQDVHPGEVLERLARANIEGRRQWKPMHHQPLFKDALAFGGTVAEKLFDQGLCLPSGGELSLEDIKQIVDIVVRR